MSRRIPVLETDRLLIRELTIDDLAAINQVLNETFGSDMTMSESQRRLQWTMLGYELFAELEQPYYGERVVVLKARLRPSA